MIGMEWDIEGKSSYNFSLLFNYLFTILIHGGAQFGAIMMELIHIYFDFWCSNYWVFLLDIASVLQC